MVYVRTKKYVIGIVRILTFSLLFQALDTQVGHVMYDKEPSEYPCTHMLMQFAQFVDHDIIICPDISEDAAPACTGCDFTDVYSCFWGTHIFGYGTLQNATCLPLCRTASEHC